MIILFERLTKAILKRFSNGLSNLQESGDIYKSFYTGYYCTPCETYVTEKMSSLAKEVFLYVVLVRVKPPLLKKNRTFLSFLRIRISCLPIIKKILILLCLQNVLMKFSAL